MFILKSKVMKMITIMVTISGLNTGMVIHTLQKKIDQHISTSLKVVMVIGN